MKPLLILLGLTAVSHGEVLLAVSPALVQPGLSPSFTLHCGLGESEGLKVVSLTLLRRTHHQDNLKSGQAERLASLSHVTPMVPEVTPGYPLLTAVGQITMLETELGTYLDLVWPHPTVQELGLYTCEAVVISETGQLVTLIAHAHVTAGDPVLDSLLFSVEDLAGVLTSFNISLQDLQTRVDDISSDLQEAPVSPAPTTEPPLEESEDENQSDTGLEESAVSQSPLERLVAGLETLTTKLDRFNSSISLMEAKLSRVDMDDVDGANETEEDNGSGPDHVLAFFAHGNSTFILITGAREFNTYTAQALCDRQGSHLAEVQDASQLEAIAENLAPFVLRAQRVLIAGRLRRAGEVWRYQESGHQVTFFGGPAPTTGSTNEATCLALDKSRDEMAMMGVSCGQSRPDTLVLCEAGSEEEAANGSSASQPGTAAPL